MKMHESQKLLEIIADRVCIKYVEFFDCESIGAQISDLEFSDCEFRDCLFEEAKLMRTKFFRCRFANCNFTSAIFYECSFFDGDNDSSQTTINFSNLNKSQFSKCNLNLVHMNKISAFNASFDNCIAHGLKFDAEVHKSIGRSLVVGGVTFFECRMHFALFGRNNLENSKFEKCELNECVFDDCNLRDSSFRESRLHNTSFERSTMDSADISFASFDDFKIAELLSFKYLTVSSEQQEIILRGIGINVIPASKEPLY